ncbi:AbrB/MazE/SpoVT family DNA-binding domain-containing protein [Pantoea eucrina]|uniref:AbrB/MazE/SpoVT family DNA-binding domain-containing protein n=1 Tax=Pantoea eucrina TaxID=472693 RepID=UPI00080F3ED5|nr:hypothetical protein [Pantoea eucrina]
MRQTIKRWGNSPAVRIPANLMALMEMDIDEEVEVTIQKDAHNVPRLVIEPARNIVTLDMLMSQVTPENTHGEVDFGEAQGKEIW